MWWSTDWIQQMEIIELTIMMVSLITLGFFSHFVFVGNNHIFADPWVWFVFIMVGVALIFAGPIIITSLVIMEFLNHRGENARLRDKIIARSPLKWMGVKQIPLLFLPPFLLYGFILLLIHLIKPFLYFIYRILLVVLDVVFGVYQCKSCHRFKWITTKKHKVSDNEYHNKHNKDNEMVHDVCDSCMIAYKMTGAFK